MDYEKTVESRILEQNPQIREKISQSPEFQEWRKSLPTFEIDGEEFYVRGGDMPKDEDQILLEWARRHHPDLVPDDTA